MLPRAYGELHFRDRKEHFELGLGFGFGSRLGFLPRRGEAAVGEARGGDGRRAEARGGGRGSERGRGGSRGGEEGSRDRSTKRHFWRGERGKMKDEEKRGV